MTQREKLLQSLKYLDKAEEVVGGEAKLKIGSEKLRIQEELFEITKRENNGNLYEERG